MEKPPVEKHSAPEDGKPNKLFEELSNRYEDIDWSKIKLYPQEFDMESALDQGNAGEGRMDAQRKRIEEIGIEAYFRECLDELSPEAQGEVIQRLAVGNPEEFVQEIIDRAAGRNLDSSDPLDSGDVPEDAKEAEPIDTDDSDDESESTFLADAKIREEATTTEEEKPPARKPVARERQTGAPEEETTLEKALPEEIAALKEKLTGTADDEKTTAVIDVLADPELSKVHTEMFEENLTVDNEVKIEALANRLKTIAKQKNISFKELLDSFKRP